MQHNTYYVVIFMPKNPSVYAVFSIITSPKSPYSPPPQTPVYTTHNTVLLIVKHHFLTIKKYKKAKELTFAFFN